jgi:hypothetical protein
MYGVLQMGVFVEGERDLGPRFRGSYIRFRGNGSNIFTLIFNFIKHAFDLYLERAL